MHRKQQSVSKNITIKQTIHKTKDIVVPFSSKTHNVKFTVNNFNFVTYKRSELRRADIIQNHHILLLLVKIKRC